MKAFVSSTFEDLKEHRAHVIRTLRMAGLTVDPMEDWPACADEPRQFSVDRVKDCDLCVLLVAKRRGFIPDKASESITQMEYRHTVENGIAVLPFLLDEEAPWVSRFDEMHRDPGIRVWREELRKRHGAPFFGQDPNSIDIGPAIARFLQDRRFGWTLAGLRSAADKASNDYIATMRKEKVYQPDLYAVRAHIELHLASFLDRQCTKAGMLIVGPSGIGKTNTLCHVVEEWRKDPGKLGNDIVFLVGAGTLPWGSSDLREILLSRLGVTDSFGVFLDQFETARQSAQTQLVIVIDAVDKHAEPKELWRQIDDLIEKSDRGWLKVVATVSEAVYEVIRRSFSPLAPGSYYTAIVEGRRPEDEVWGGTRLDRMTDGELREAYEKYRMQPALRTETPYDSLTMAVKHAISNPLFLRIVMEVHKGEPTPAEVLTARVFYKYCDKKVFSDPKRTFLINRLTDHLYKEKATAIAFDALSGNDEVREYLIDSSPTSPYEQLIDDRILERRERHISRIFPTEHLVGFAYDRMLEYFLAYRIASRCSLSADTVASLSHEAVDYLPIRGVMAALIRDKIDDGAYDEAARWLNGGNPDVMRSVATGLLLDMEQMAPIVVQVTADEVAACRAAKFMSAMLAENYDWIVDALLESARRLEELSLYHWANYTLDKLATRLDRQVRIVTMATYYRLRGDIHSSLGRKEDARADYEEALDLCRHARDGIGESEVLGAIGGTYFDLGALDRAREEFDRSITIARDLATTNPTPEVYKVLARSLSDLSEVHKRTGNRTEALTTAEQARSIHEKSGDQRGLAAAIDRIGDLLRRTGDMARAIEFHRRALEIHQTIGARRGIADSLRLWGLVCVASNDWQEARTRLGSALKIFEDIDCKDGIAHTCNAFGECYRFEGKQLDKSAEYYERSLQLFVNLGEERNVEMLRNNLGANCLSMHEYAKAVEHLQAAISLQQSILGIKGKPETLAYLSGAWLELGDLKKAREASDVAVEVVGARGFSTEDVQLVYWYRFRILTLAGSQPEASDALRLAYDNVMEQAGRLEDPVAINRFIQDIWFRRETVDAWRTRTT